MIQCIEQQLAAHYHYGNRELKSYHLVVAHLIAFFNPTIESSRRIEDLTQVAVNRRPGMQVPDSTDRAADVERRKVRLRNRRATADQTNRSKKTGEGMNWQLEVLKKHAVFSGRARRREYWMLLLFIIIAFVFGFVETLVGGAGIAAMLYNLAVLFAGIAVRARRFHETGRRGWRVFSGLVPRIGVVVLLVFMVSDSNPFRS